MSDEDSDQSDQPPPAEPDNHGNLVIAAGDGAGDDVDLPWLRRMLRAVIARLQVSVAALNVVVVGDARMTQLHQQFRGETGTTDVLAFDMAEKPTGDALEGEIYICADEARRRAAELGHEVSAELLLYATHGLLHLLGYDDQGERDYRSMHRKEDELLSAVGVGRVFAPAPAAAKKPKNAL